MAVKYPFNHKDCHSPTHTRTHTQNPLAGIRQSIQKYRKLTYYITVMGLSLFLVVTPVKCKKLNAEMSPHDCSVIL